MHLSSEVQYLVAIVGLFVVSRVLQRFRIPTALTCVGIGAAAGMGFHAFHDDTTVPMLATLGIVALFLFAGLEVDLGELRRGARVLASHLFLQCALLAGASYGAWRVLHLRWEASLLLALAVLTPSTGFILDSLASFGLDEPQRFWVKSKAIASELVALGALFVTVQSSSARTLGLSSAALLLMIGLLPLLFLGYVRYVLPHAARSEFPFLVIVALGCALLTRKLGVYYLVGAFVVGVTAVGMKERFPALASERLLIGVELFASFFIPFYFFKAGLHLHAEYFTPRSVGLGLLFVAGVVPLRIGIVAIQRRITLREPLKQGARVGLSLVPTLVFTLVLADILQERYALPAQLYGALLVFTLTNTMLPGLLLRSATPEFASPALPRNSLAPPPRAPVPTAPVAALPVAFSLPPAVESVPSAPLA